jgi:hypothetical protein
MSQEYNTIARRPRRSRAPRSRPVLVTENEATSEETPPTTENLAFDLVPTINEAEAVAAPVQVSRNPLRLPKFFSKVEHKEEESSTSTDEVVEARMARAKKSLSGKAAATTTEVVADESAKPVVKAKAAPATPAKPRLFKSRHIIGMVAYLFGANLLLPAEASFILSSHLEKNLYRIPGINLQVTTSLLANIVTLVVCLYLLVAFDLLPNGKQLSANQVKPRSSTRTSSSNNSQSTLVRTPQPTVRQGVKGESDDLYQSYRSNQRKRR